MKSIASGTGLFLMLLTAASLLVPSVPVVRAMPAQTDPHEIQKNYLIQKLEDSGAYVNREHRFGLKVPKGLHVLPHEEVVKIVTAGRQKDGIDTTDDSTINQTIIQALDFDPAGRRILITPETPYFQTLEEFERATTPPDLQGDFVYHAREKLNVNKHPGYLLDREFDSQGLRVRQWVVFITDFPALPGKPPTRGFNIVFGAISVDFDEYEQAFRNCLNSFTVIPPDLPEGYREAKYSLGIRGIPGLEKEIEETPAWRTPEVIGSLIFVGLFVIWFLVKKLSAGVEEDEEFVEGEEPADPGGASR
jgi:hypothetical protein